MQRKVVITGMGILSPIGNSVDEFDLGLRNGHNGIGPITQFDTNNFNIHIAGEVKIDLDNMTKILLSKLTIDDVFYCLHDNHDMCKCRKPLPGLILFAKDKWNIDLNKSIMIGDTEKDYFAAKNSKVEFYLLDNRFNENLNSSNIITNISEIIDKIN